MADRFPEFQSLGVGVLAVSMGRPEAVARYLGEQPLPFPLLADPDRTGYAAFGLGRTTWRQILRPGVLWRFAGHILRGARVRPVAKGEDALQIGGDFLLDPDRRLRWAFTSPDPTARPTVDQLVTEARQLSEKSP